MKKSFKIEDVISSVLGILLCPIGNVYECLNFLTGDNLYTHQLPRAGRECLPAVLEQHPFLKEINLEGINPENWQTRLSEIKNKYPNVIDLAPVNTYQHKNMISELSEMMSKPPSQ